MYLCLKESVIPLKKNSQVILRLPKNMIHSKPRKEDILDFSQKCSLFGIAVSEALMKGGCSESKRCDVVSTWDAPPLSDAKRILFLLLVTTPTLIPFLCVLIYIPPL